MNTLDPKAMVRLIRIDEEAMSSAVKYMACLGPYETANLYRSNLFWRMQQLVEVSDA